MEDSVTGGIHDEIYDQVGCTFFIQMTLDICQTHLTSAHRTRSGASSCKGDNEKEAEIQTPPPYSDGTSLLV